MDRGTRAHVASMLLVGLLLCAGPGWQSAALAQTEGSGSAPESSTAQDDDGDRTGENVLGVGPAIIVTAANVRLTAPRDRITSIGTGKAIRSVDVTADVAGTIETVHVAPNTSVDAGAPLVTLERQSEEILLGSAKAELEKQQATFQRYEALRSRNSSAISAAQVDEARADLAVAQANVAEAQYEYDRRVIRAPFAGRINLNDLTIGTYLPQGETVVTLIDASSLLVEFLVPETVVDKIELDLPVRLSTPSVVGRFFSGKVVAFDSSIDAEFRTVRVRAEVENVDLLLLPGMTFNVTVISRDQPLPVVPAISILWGRDGAYVWRLGADNRPEQVPVVIRHRQGDRVWVDANLGAGDRVVEEGAFKINADSQLDITDEPIRAGPVGSGASG